jgi:hypothetical protein
LLKHHHGIAPQEKYFEKRLVKILQLFVEGKRPEIMKALALWNAIIERNPKKAREMVDIACKSIDGDKKLDELNRKDWKKEFEPVLEIVKDIEDLLK